MSALTTLDVPAVQDFATIKTLDTFNSLKVIATSPRRILLEAEPERRLFWFSDQPYHIPFPWLYYSVTRITARNWNTWGGRHYEPEHFKMRGFFCAPRRLKLGDPLCRVPVPNLYNNAPCYVGSKSGIPASEGIADAITNWWGQSANMDAFPRTDPVILHLAHLAGVIGPDSTYMGGSYGNAKKVYTAWEGLTEKQSLKLPYRELNWTPHSFMGPITKRSTVGP